MRTYTPRRCSTRWLDADCPDAILAIIDTGPKNTDRYDVIYRNVETVQYRSIGIAEQWMILLAVSESGYYYHAEMKVHEVAAYRYRMAHRYTRWSTLPERVKRAVWADLDMNKHAFSQEGN